MLGHAGRLAARGFEVELVVTQPDAPRPAGSPVPVLTLAGARARSYDVALATWWRTAPLLWELDCRRRVLFLQSLEYRFYREELFDALEAEAVLSMPVGFVAVSHWIAAEVEERRVGVRCHVVRNGVDKAVFGSRPRSEPQGGGPLRVLVDGQPTLWFKGAQEALAATRAMTEPVHVTLVALDPPAESGGADRVVGGLDAHGMANLYAENDIVLKLSRVEGLGMTPLEGFHFGVPCVVYPYTAHDEYVEHGVNGFVAEFDDLPAVTGWLDLLARDRQRLGRMSQAALDTASGWPDEQSSTDDLVGALEAIAAEAQPQPPEAWHALWRTVSLRSELGAERLRRLHYAEAGLDKARAHVIELSESRDECAEMLRDAHAQIEAIRSTRFYRAFNAARRLAEVVRR